jgi:coenzyme PQQ precursor peptide PqqA
MLARSRAPVVTEVAVGLEVTAYVSGDEDDSEI